MNLGLGGARPMAPQVMRSLMYWPVTMSRNSVAVGMPVSLMSTSSLRASFSPSLTSKLPSRRGSLMSPPADDGARLFEVGAHHDAQALLYSSRRVFRRRAYSWAAAGSWMEQGPTMTSRR